MLLVVLSIVAHSAAAQETGGAIRGRLIGGGAGVAGAEITAASDAMLGERRVESARDGAFHLAALPPGRYTLRIRTVGFRALTIQDVGVRLGLVAGLGDIALEPAATVLEEMTIAAPALTLDPVSTAWGGAVDGERLALLPAGRDYASVMAMLPHVNASFHGDPPNAAGATGLENAFFIDGVNVTEPKLAATATALPSNFIRAVEVRTGGYEAQYGRALGAVVNAVTVTGSNTFDASIFAYGTHSALSTRSLARPAFRDLGSSSYDVGIRVGGPILRDRLWYSAAYNPRFSTTDRAVAALGTFTERSRADVYAAKVSWRASRRTTMEVSLFGDPATSHEVDLPDFWATLTLLQPDPALHYSESGSTTASWRLTSGIGPNLHLDATLAASSFRAVSMGETPAGRSEPVFVDAVAGTIAGGYFEIAADRQRRRSALLRATLDLGRHTVVAGAEYDVATAIRDWRSTSIGQVTDTGGGFKRMWQSTVGAPRNTTPTAYVQDAWRITDDLTVNVGLRWSSQTLAWESGAVAQRFPNEWQPRIGVVGRPSSRARVTASWGRFYQQQPLNLSTLYFAVYCQAGFDYDADPRQAGVVPQDGDSACFGENEWPGSMPGMQLENHDEFTVGYEQLLGSSLRLTLRGVHRGLRSTYQQGYNGSFLLGTPGRGQLAFLPPPRRVYQALEAGLDGRWGAVDLQASYVLSRAWGNITGLYATDAYLANPGVNVGMTEAQQARHSTGLLPNDRPHAVKLVATARPLRRLSIGTFATWQSGTPLTAFGDEGFFPVFVSRRGAAGRTPAIWDVNFRIVYAVTPALPHARLIVDLLHIGDPQAAVRRDQVVYRGTPGNLSGSYGQPILFQPPMAARLGIEIDLRQR